MRNTFDGSAKTVVQAGEVHGDVHIHEPRDQPGDRIGRPIREYRDPFALEVHRAIVAGAAPPAETLPRYVPRAHDNTLLDVIDQSASSSRIAVLVGESSSGKTRACWEAIQKLPDRWWLWHPIDPTRPGAVLAGLNRIEPHTVIWLNEFQHYLLTPGTSLGERVAAGLRALLGDPDKAPVVILGTLWPQHHDDVTVLPQSASRDPHAQARSLLAGNTINVPDVFAGADLDRMRAAAPDDPRLAWAVERAEHGHVAQYLAGGPALLERYANATAETRAVLTAAIDARRLGHGLDLAPEFLKVAAAGYITQLRWDKLGKDWFDSALASATADCVGARSPLTLVQAKPDDLGSIHSRYRLADYLEQEGQRIRALDCPPNLFWSAAVRYVTDPTSLFSMARAAEERGRYQWATQLYDAASQAGGPSPLNAAATLWAADDGCDGFERLRRIAAVAGSIDAADYLAERAEGKGNLDQAEQLFRLMIGAGDTSYLWDLARMRQMQGDIAEAEQLFREAVAAGHSFALEDLAELRAQQGDEDEVDQLLQQIMEIRGAKALSEWAMGIVHRGTLRWREQLCQVSMAAGDPDALYELVRLREKSGDRAGAERLLIEAGQAGEPEAFCLLAYKLEERGDLAGAKLLYHSAAEAGSGDALTCLAVLHELEGDHDRAEEAALKAARLGNTEGLSRLARSKEETDDLGGADRLLVAAAEAGDIYARSRAVELREHLGNQQGAEDLAYAGMATGDGYALAVLARLRRSSDLGSAKQLYRAAIVGDHLSALLELAELCEIDDWGEAEQLYGRAARVAAGQFAIIGRADNWKAARDYGRARRLYRIAAAGGSVQAQYCLVLLHDESGDHDGAESLARSAAVAGHPFVLRHLASRREKAGDWSRAERLHRADIDGGDRMALERLIHLFVRWGRRSEADAIRKFGLDAAGQPAEPW